MLKTISRFAGNNFTKFKHTFPTTTAFRLVLNLQLSVNFLTNIHPDHVKSTQKTYTIDFPWRCPDFPTITTTFSGHLTSQPLAYRSASTNFPLFFTGNDQLSLYYRFDICSKPGRWRWRALSHTYTRPGLWLICPFWLVPASGTGVKVNQWRSNNPATYSCMI